MEITDEVRSRMGTATITDGTWTLTSCATSTTRWRRCGGRSPSPSTCGTGSRATSSASGASGADIALPFWPDVVEKYEVAEPNTHGHIEVWEPPTRFELRWEGDRLRWRARADRDGHHAPVDDRHRGPGHRHRRGRRATTCASTGSRYGSIRERRPRWLDHPKELEAEYAAAAAGGGPMRSAGHAARGGRLLDAALRARFDHPIDKVWRAVIEPEHRDPWFPQRIVGDLAPGETASLRRRPEHPRRGLRGSLPRGRRAAPARARVGRGPAPHGAGTRWRRHAVRAPRHARGATPRARTGAGWHLCLEGLHAEVDGGARPPETDEAIWNEVHGAYLDAVGGERHVWGQMPA